MLVRSKVNVLGGASGGTDYSLASACRSCGSGAVQKGPLLLPAFRAPRSPIFSTLDDEVLVKSELAKELRCRGLGHLLGLVVSVADGAVRDESQLIPQSEMPRLTGATRGIERELSCKICGRDGHFGMVEEPMVLRFEKESDVRADLLSTYELFGNSRLREPFSDSVFAAPLLIVSDAFRQVVQEAEGSKVEFQEISWRRF